MPELGETKRGREIGIKDGSLYIWAACVDCGKERWVRLKKGRQPTSILCHPCSMKRANYHGHPKRELNHRWKGGRLTDMDGYISILLPTDSFFLSMATNRGYVLEHRLVVAKKLGRCLHPWEIVHHLNGIRGDNRAENLALTMTQYHEKYTLENALKKRIQLLEKQNKQLKEATNGN